MSELRYCDECGDEMRHGDMRSVCETCREEYRASWMRDATAAQDENAELRAEVERLKDEAIEARSCHLCHCSLLLDPDPPRCEDCHCTEDCDHD